MSGVPRSTQTVARVIIGDLKKSPQQRQRKRHLERNIQYYNPFNLHNESELSWNVISSNHVKSRKESKNHCFVPMFFFE